MTNGKKILSPLTEEQTYILKKEGTELPFSSPLYEEKREGIYVCAGCNQPLFSSLAKYNSGTGWPSFHTALPHSLETKEDRSKGQLRTEYHCSNCGGHHGHKFNDGPQPTGIRYCNNGTSLKFIENK